LRWPVQGSLSRNLFRFIYRFINKYILKKYHGELWFYRMSDKEKKIISANTRNFVYKNMSTVDLFQKKI
jgi:hypothetical protein